jgi:hypothetical protein
MTHETETDRTPGGSADIPRIYYDLRRRNDRRAGVAAILAARREERAGQIKLALLSSPRPGRTRA